jgi:hypothetical protein
VNARGPRPCWLVICRREPYRADEVHGPKCDIDVACANQNNVDGSFRHLPSRHCSPVKKGYRVRRPSSRSHNPAVFGLLVGAIGSPSAINGFNGFARVNLPALSGSDCQIVSATAGTAHGLHRADGGQVQAFDTSAGPTIPLYIRTSAAGDGVAVIFATGCD